MSQQKKSFILHIDSLDVIDDLTDEQAGQLFRAIKSYHVDGAFEPSAIIKVAFAAFKSQFNRDLEKYERIVTRNKNNGLKGGRPKTQEIPEEPKKPSGLSGNPEEPKKPDSVNGSVSGIDNGSESEGDKPSSKDSGEKPPKYDDQFLEFWLAYPQRKRKSKATAYKAWVKLDREEKQSAIDVIPKASQQPDWVKDDGKFIPLPSTWLNASGWEDELQQTIRERYAGLSFDDKPQGAVIDGEVVPPFGELPNG